MNRTFRRLAVSVTTIVLVLGFIACSRSREIAQPSRVEAAYDRFDQFQQSTIQSDLLTRIAASRIDERYRMLFSPYQTSSALAKLAPSDVALLFQAASDDFLYSVSAASLHDMQLDVAELHRRGIARKDHYEKIYAALLESRLFDKARALAILHPLASAEAVPYVENKVAHKGPTTLLVRDGGKKLQRKSVDLTKGRLIVVIASPLCHFCQRAIASIENDRSLRPLIRDRALWLVPPDQSTPFAVVATWNRVHPHQQMEYAYRREEWPMVERWETPVFYFLKDGRVVSIVTGWPRAGRKADIRRSLKLAGLI